MTTSSPYTWPPKSRISFYNGRGRLLWQVPTNDLDLFDELFQLWDKASRTIYLGFSTNSKKWSNWDEKNLSTIEAVIRYDLTFDGNKLKMTRISLNAGANCSEEFVWKIIIR